MRAGEWIFVIVFCLFALALDESSLVKQMNTLKANGPFAEIMEASDLIVP